MRKLTALVAAGAAALAALADFSQFSGLDFAEKYAFSTNRAALIAELKRDTGAWYFYSLLNLQTEGEAGKAEKFVKTTSRGDRQCEAAWHRLQLRQMFLAWEASQGKPRGGGRTPDEFLSWDLRSFLGIHAPDYVREVAAAPNTYPSSLDQNEISFDAFLKNDPNSHDSLKDEFRFLHFSADLGIRGGQRYFDVNRYCEPGTPGFFDAVCNWMAEHQTFNTSMAFNSLTLDELCALADKFGGAAWKVPLLENSAFIDAVMKRLAPGADDDPSDDNIRRAWLDRRLAFCRRLPPSQDGRKADAMRAILELERSRGNFTDRALLTEFAKMTMAKDAPGPIAAKADAALVNDFLAALCRAGDDLDDFKDIVKAETLSRIRAEAALLDAKAPDDADLRAIPENDFAALRDRIEIKWAASNPSVFTAEMPVALDVDVKNVAKMRLAVYEIDAYRATASLGEEPQSDIDLDGCVPTFERTLDFTRFAPIVRHREHLEFPELAKCGVYVVECSGAGVSSRAIVRKGAIRVTERVTPSGHVFAALDENGAILKSALVRVGESVYSAGEDGLVTIPFATAAAAGQKKAIVGAQGRAAVKTFTHRAEEYFLQLRAFLPAEAAIAGETAKAMLHARLTVAGEKAPVALVEKCVLTVRITGGDGDVTVKRIEPFALDDAAEQEFSFVVPKRFSRITFSLAGKVESASEGKSVDVCGEDTLYFNGAMRTSRIAQAFLRHGADGYSIELLGRNGEPVAGREIGLSLSHVAFNRPKSLTLQTDESGRIALGDLSDITEIEMTAPMTCRWSLKSGNTLALPDSLCAAQGEPLEVAIDGLTDGDWPLAGDLAARASLAAVNSEGAVTATLAQALSYTNGVLRISPLPAGDYILYLRAEGVAIPVMVAKTAPAAQPANGIIPGLRRALGATRATGRMRIAAASRDKNTLRAKIENATPSTRVHVMCSRFVPRVGDMFEFAASLPERKDSGAIAWPPAKTEYISGRDLGDTLRYILERRSLEHRPGNMLAKPSLLLAPWSVGETRSFTPPVNAGESWSDKAKGPAVGLRSLAGSRSPQAVCATVRPDDLTPTCDFLAKPASMWCNLRPDENGEITLELPQGAQFQDVAIVAVDDESADGRRVLAQTAPLELRDLRHRAVRGRSGIATLVRECKVVKGAPDKAEGTRRERYCRSVEDAFALVRAVADGNDFEAFSFLAKWPNLSREEQTALYGEYASHELDLFLYFKDRDFFDGVIAPNLRNKRFKQFIDKWLLGEDVTAWAEPGAFDDLNALEHCLLAIRVPRLAPVIANAFAEECQAHPLAPEFRDQRLALALNIAQDEDMAECDDEIGFGGASGDVIEMAAAHFAAPAAAPAEEMQRAFSMQMKGERSAKREAKPRQPYRPIDKTREWIETHHYRVRHANDDATHFGPNGFWRDYAAAIANGQANEFLSENIIYIGNGLTECLGAIAVLDLPFGGDGARGALAFSEQDVVLEDSGVRDIGVVQRFIDAEASDNPENRDAGKFAVNEFVAGKPYTLVTVFSNPTDKEVRFNSLVQVPDGAIALDGAEELFHESHKLGSYSMAERYVRFYFPAADGECGSLGCAVAMANRAVIGVADNFTCNVVAKPSKEDTASWQWISQQGTDDEVVNFLDTANLRADGIDLGKIGWRMKDDAFARRVFDALDRRGMFHEGLWLTTLEGRYRISDFQGRVRQLLSRRAMKKRLAPLLGPSFHCSLVDIDPEDADLFEYAEFWPLVNARAHAAASRKTVIPNESLKRNYRDFLDLLATKKSLSAKDRMDAAVYLIAQERVGEAEKIVEGVGPADTDMQMQLDYLRAYFAFSHLQPEEGRAIALKYADWPVPRWRDRFRAVIAQADEIAGRAPAQISADRPEVSCAPSIELAAAAHEIAIRSRNVASVKLRAYLTDAEVSFSKNPFDAGSASSASVFLRPAWETEIAIGDDGTAKIALPESLRDADLLLEASDADSRTAASLAVPSGRLDVQVATEYGELRVRDMAGRAIGGAYVKVYARDAARAAVKFHKDGYTDMRGAFNYADISSDEGFKAAEFAILVLSGGGARTLSVKAPSGGL